MKLNKWLYGAAAALMLGACSDNFSDAPNAPGQAAEEGQGYIGINLQLPTVSGTRANDSFDDGELSEYVIKDAVLLLFQGADATSARLTGVFTLNEANPTDDPTIGQITRHSIRVANVTGVKFDETNKLYALVMANGVENGLYNLNDPDAAWMWTDQKDADGNNIGKTIRELQETILEMPANKFYTQTQNGKEYANYIFMTNSPLADKKGGMSTSEEGPVISSALPVLVNLNTTVYDNQKDAIDNPAGTIHIERIVGKVTCSSFNKATELTVTVNGHEYDLEVDKIWWDMAQDMAQTYVVRNTNRNPKGTEATSANYMWRWNYASDEVDDTSNNYFRMLGYTAIPVKENGTNKEYYRPYFCQVPGYNQSKTVGENSDDYENKKFNKTSMKFEDNPVEWTMGNGASASSPGAFYPLENTFPVEYMKYANTTRVGFWVTFKFKPKNGAPALNLKDANFYIKGTDETTLYLDDPDGYDPLTNLAIAELSDRSKDKNKDLWDAIDAALDKEEEGSISDVKISDLIDFEYESKANAQIVIKSVKFKTLDDIHKKYANFKAAPEYQFSANRITELNNLGTYYKYTAGRTFYEVRVMHFGDDNTPWDADKLPVATTIDESYGDDPVKRRVKYLGRYGIVRNNWYDLNVKVIKTLGDPQDPALWDANWPGKPDDNKDQYIAVELRVLSWAQRSQDVEF